MRGARLVRHIGQGTQQLVVVDLVRAVHARVEGRIEAGRAPQRINADAGVVGQGRQTRRVGRVPGLQEGILDEGVAGLVRTLDAEFRLRDEFDAGASQQLAQFDELAGVAAGEDYLVHSTISHMAVIPAKAGIHLVSITGIEIEMDAGFCARRAHAAPERRS
jgi:hypothetical protein